MIRFINSVLAKPALFIIAGIGITLATTGVTAVSLYQMRLDAMAQARIATENLAASLQVQIERNLDVHQMAMRDALTAIQTPSIQKLPPEVRHRIAFSTATNANGLGTLFVTDATGQIVSDSHGLVPANVNVSDRDYFQVQQGQTDAGLYLSRPFLSHIDHKDPLSIALSKRVEDRHGRFAGIVVATLRLSYFHQLFENSILRRHGTITLMRTDGLVLMRQPLHPGDIGSSLTSSSAFASVVKAPAKTYVSLAVLDHVERLYSSRRIGHYPLVVVVGFATEDIYAQWRWRAVTIGLVTATLDALFIALSLMFSRQLRRRIAMERRLQTLAWYDSLTGLPNRAQLKKDTRRILKRARHNGSTFATLFIDLDRFKRVNDTEGHATGDEVLTEISRRLREIVHGEYVVGRLGGDEFLAILQHCDVRRATQVAARILQAVHRPIVINSTHNTSITIGASIGIALYPHDGQDADTLLRNADLAMYQAKSAGHNQVRFYAPEYEREVREHLELEIALQQALKKGELSIAWQPKVDAWGALRGAEALVRWRDGTRGFVPADRFIAIAEESGLITDIDAWVLGEACRQLAEWRANGLELPNISVNVCAADVKRPDFAAFVADTLQAHGLRPDDLILEMTERVMFEESSDTIRSTLEAIHALGVALSIDDFGTGYSSLSYLHRFPVQELKIDKSFVRGIGGNAMAESLAQTVINIGNTLKLTVIAEGVETQPQRDFLSKHGCNLYQGYLFSRPLAPEDFAAWCQQRRIRSRDMVSS